MKSPLITIIIPTYNRDYIIDQAINSIILQTYAHWECIVIDDGSEEETLEILQGYHNRDSRIMFFKRQREPKGAPTCRNIGLQQAKGDFVIFLDSDDYLMPFCLEQRVTAIKEYPECQFLVFPMGEQQNGVIIKKPIPFYYDYLVPFLSANLPWSIMCPIWKRSFLLKLKGFSESYPRFNDPELMIRALLHEHVTYKVFNELKYDTVFVRSEKEKISHNEKVYKSLQLLLKDTCFLLAENKKGQHKKYLVYYLHFWFKYSFMPLRTYKIKRSMQLLNLFYQKHVITFSLYIKLMARLFLYLFSRLFLKTSIDKLSDKSIYKISVQYI